MYTVLTLQTQESNDLSAEFSRGLPTYFVADREFSFSFSDALPLYFFNRDSFRRVYSQEGIKTYFPTLSRVIENSQISAVFDDSGYENYSFFLRNLSTTAHISFYTRYFDGSSEREAKNYFIEKRIGQHSATFFLVNQSLAEGSTRRDSVFAYMRYGFEGNGFGIHADRELLKQVDGTISAVDHARLYYKNIAFDIEGLEGDSALRGALTAKFNHNELKTTINPGVMGEGLDVSADMRYKGIYLMRHVQHDWLGTNTLKYHEIGYGYNEYATVYCRHIETMRYASIAMHDEYIAGVMWNYPFEINDSLSISFDGDVISDPSFFSTAHTSMVFSRSFFENDLTLTAFIRNNYTARSLYAPTFITWDAYIEALLISARFFVLTENVLHQKYYNYNGQKGEGLRVKFGFSWSFYN